MHREYAALAVLVIAVAVALPFILFRNEGNAPDPLPTMTPVPTYTATPVPPTPTATPTPIPDRGSLSAPEVWTVTFYRDLAGGRDEDDTVFLGSLDLAFDGPPFVDYREGAWGILISAGWENREPGRYRFALAYDCDLSVTAGGETVFEAVDPAGPREAGIELVHEGGPIQVSIEAAAAPGGFLIRWE